MGDGEPLTMSMFLRRDHLEDARLDRLVKAARAYFDHYCQDEASEDGPTWTGCSVAQHEAAKELGAALEPFANTESAL